MIGLEKGGLRKATRLRSNSEAAGYRKLEAGGSAEGDEVDRHYRSTHSAFEGAQYCLSVDLYLTLKGGLHLAERTFRLFISSMYKDPHFRVQA